MSDDTHESPRKTEVKAPVPINGHAVGLPRVSSQYSLKSQEVEEPPRSFTPGIAQSSHRARQPQFRRRPSYNSIEGNRERHYNLDYPENVDELKKLQLDPTSRFFARSRPRTLDLPGMLPYKAESPRDQAKFLSHIVSHLYIAIKTLDLQGSLAVTANELAALKDLSNGSDIDVALETNLFEMNSTNETNYDEDGSNYFSNDESDSDDDDDDEDDELGADGGMEDDGETTNQHRKSPKSAAIIGVKTWTHELLVWLKMKYDMPLSLRSSLAKVYYSLALSRGQHLNLKTYVKTFDQLTKNSYSLRQHGLTLPWEALYNELNNHFPSIDSSMDPLESKDHKQLLSLAAKASPFFDNEALPIIYSRIGSKFSIANASLVLSSMSLLPLKFTSGGIHDPKDIRHYLASFFYMWKKLSKSSGFDSQITSRLGLIAMSALFNINDDPQSKTYIEIGEHGIFTDEQMNFMINTLINSLSIMVEKYSSMKTKFFHGFASTIIYSIKGGLIKSGGILENLETLLNAIQSYIHPSNSGEWSRPISKLVLSLIYQFHKRYCSETEAESTLSNLPSSIKLSRKVTDKFVSMFLPIVKIGIQSKKASATEDYLTCLQLLGYLNPTLVLENMLLDIYESLEGVISTHRVIIALRSIEPLGRFFASTPIYRVHLVRLLTLCLPGIDSNDLEKTLHTLDAFSSVANFVPFHDLSEGEGDPSFSLEFTQSHLEYLQRKLYSETSEKMFNEAALFEIDEETELLALKSSTSSFKQLIKALNQRLFLLFENLPDPSKTEGVERDLISSIPKYIYVLLESFSDDVYKSFQQEFFDFIFNNTYHTIADVTAEICGGIIKRNPKSFRTYGPTMIERIREEIEENGAGQSRTGVDILPRDQNLFWNLVILNECIGNAGSEVLALSHELISLSYYLMDNVKGPVVFASSYLINQVLQSVTKIRLMENRLIAPSYVKKYGVDAKCWGGFQFSKTRFSKENLEFDWFIPGEKEVAFAVDSFNEHVVRCLKNISEIMRDFKTDQSKSGSIQLTDDIRTNLLYIGYALSGISYLLDPSFDEDIPKLNHENESVEKRLLLLKQIRNAKETKEDDRDLDISDHLEKIVQDLSTDYMEVDDYNGSKEDQDANGSKDLVSANDVPVEISDDSKSVSRSTSPMDVAPPETSSTPQVDDVDISSINPSSTFRERKLYTSFYYFGDDIEKRKSNDLYLKLHKTHHFVGKSLHVICKFLTTYFHDNTKLFKHLLYVINIWFSDVGRERILDSSHSKIHYGYISCIQSVNSVRKPYTRIAIGSRIESYHSLRVSLHSTSRTQTQLDKWLIEDIVKLSLSTYTTISSPAQSLLVDIMKRVGGAYGVIVKSTFKHLTKVLDDTERVKPLEVESTKENKKTSDGTLERIIESGLNVFALKRIKSKLNNDFFNLQRYVELLLKCQEIDSLEVQTLSQKLMEGVYTYVTVPSNICIIDFEAIDAIKPPDEFIDLEIKIIRLAKEKKRRVYYDKLAKIEDYMMSAENLSSHWKTTSLHLNLMISLQSELELDLRVDVLKKLIEKSSSDHPLISRLSLKGLTRIFNKLYLLQSVNYDLRNAYDLDYVMKDYKVIDTSPTNGDSYFKIWERELKNTNDPSFFVDFRASVGWMFWDKTMVVNSNEPSFELLLKTDDRNFLEEACELFNKEWLLEIVMLWITENEANSAFQGTDVFFTSTLVLLISSGFAKNLKFENLMEIIQEIYVEDDKSVHIVICELITGILLGSKWTHPSFVEQRDDFISSFLKNIFENDLSPDNRGIWTIFSWWLPSHIDIRRFPKIISTITNFTVDKDSDSVVRQATRISYIRSLLTSVTWNYSDPDAILNFCLDNINHRYEAIRTQVGSLMAVLSFPYYGESKANSEVFVKGCNEKKDLVLYSDDENNKLLMLIPELFTKIEGWRQEVIGLSPQEILKTDYIYTSTTVLTWLRQELNTSVGILFQKYVDVYIVPFLLKLINMKEVCQLGNIDPITVIKKASQIQYDGEFLERIVQMLEKYSTEDLNVVQSIIMGEFTETFYFKNLFKLSVAQRRRIIDLTFHMVYHKNVEIRESEASTLSGLIHISPPKEVEKFVKESIQTCTKDLDRIRKKYKKAGYNSLESDDVRLLHGATLGLGSLVHAFSFSSPPPKWVPEILTKLANKSSGLPGIIGKTAKNTLGKFKKDRQDTWHIDSKVFSEDQIQDLEGVLWKSYFI